MINVEKYKIPFKENTIYTLESENELISENFNKFCEAISNSKVEHDLSEIKHAMFLLTFDYTINNKTSKITLVSTKQAITVLKNKLSFVSPTILSEFNKKLITFNHNIDGMIVDNKVYFFNSNVERLFDMEKSLKIYSKKVIDIIVGCNIISNEDKFKEFSLQGYKYRKLNSFNTDNIKFIKEKDEFLVNKFGLIYDGEKVDTSTSDNVDKLVKILCDNAMIDPFTNEPKEVFGSTKWEK